MNKKEIMDYVTQTPHNINKNILGQKLDQYASQSGGGNAVQYVEQTLTEEQQMTARKNLGLYNKKITAVDAIPEQQVTFSDGSASCSDTKDLCYDLGILKDYAKNSCQLVLEINGEKYECEAQYYYGLNTNFDGPYSSDGYHIYLSEGATVQNGDTVTVHMYAITEVIEKIPEEYLPTSIPSITEGEHGNIVMVSDSRYSGEVPVPTQFMAATFADVKRSASYKSGDAIFEDDLDEANEIELYGMSTDAIEFIASGDIHYSGADGAQTMRCQLMYEDYSGDLCAGPIIFDHKPNSRNDEFMIHGSKIGYGHNWLIHYRIGDTNGSIFVGNRFGDFNYIISLLRGIKLKSWGNLRFTAETTDCEIMYM